MLFAIPLSSFGCIHALLHQTFLFLGQLLQLFEVSQILEFLRSYHISLGMKQSFPLPKSSCYLDLLGRSRSLGYILEDGFGFLRLFQKRKTHFVAEVYEIDLHIRSNFRQENS